MKSILTILFMVCALAVNAQTFLIPLGKNTEWCLNNLPANDHSKLNQKTLMITVKYETYTAFYLIDIDKNICFSITIKSINEAQHKDFIKDLNSKAKKVEHVWHLQNVHNETIIVTENKEHLTLTYEIN